jgi:hypothetical protein
MGTTYLIPVGTRVYVVCPGRPFFRPRFHKTRRDLLFDSPATDEDGIYTFALGQWRIRVTKNRVYRLTGGGGQGAIEQCE